MRTRGLNYTRSPFNHQYIKNVFVTESMDHLLAVKNDRSSIRDLRKTDLDKRIKIFSHYYCSTLKERRYGPKSTCLSGIYRSKLDDISENCNVVFAHKQEIVERVNHRTPYSVFPLADKGGWTFRKLPCKAGVMILTQQASTAARKYFRVARKFSKAGKLT